MEPADEIPEVELPRQLVVAVYAPPEQIFIVPKGFDLNNKEQVKEHWIRYGTLYISLTNGKVLKVSEYQDIEEEDDLRYPEKTFIEDTDEWHWFDAKYYEEPPLQYGSYNASDIAYYKVSDTL